MSKSFMTHVAGRLRETAQGLTRRFTTSHLPQAATAWGRFERLELALYRELAFHLDFFEEEIAALRTLWCLLAGGRRSSNSYPLFCANCPWGAAGTLRRPAPSALLLQPAFRRRRVRRRGWQRPDFSALN